MDVPDYWDQWQQAIRQAMNTKDMAWALTLGKKCQDTRVTALPPNRPPPPSRIGHIDRGGGDYASDGTIGTAETEDDDAASAYTSNTSLFSALVTGDDISLITQDTFGSFRVAGATGSVASEAKEATEHPRIQIPERGFKHQWRYIRVHIVCCVAELLMLQALSTEGWWSKCQLWTQAFNQVNNICLEMDQWRAYYFQAQEYNSNRLGEYHNKETLEELFVNVDMLRDQLEKKKTRAVEDMQKRKAFLEGKLRPQWDTRDEAKRKMGEDRWNNNPHPKGDYARLRAQNEKELRELVQALEQMEELTLENWSRLA